MGWSTQDEKNEADAKHIAERDASQRHFGKRVNQITNAGKKPTGCALMLAMMLLGGGGLFAVLITIFT